MIQGDRHIERQLWRMLKAAGFQDLNLELIASHSDELGMDAFLPQLDPDFLSQLVNVGVCLVMMSFFRYQTRGLY